jgi:hypothetical protein
MINTMQPITKITIPQPCHQRWDNMNESNNGRFCSNCSKTVVDFTTMTDREVIDYLSAAHHKTCGRFSETQYSAINHHLYAENLTSAGWWKRMILAIGMLSAVQYVKAQTTPEKPNTEQAPVSIMMGKVAIASKDSTYHTVTGSIIDEADKSLLPGVTVKVEGTTIGTMTNAEGKFMLRVPVSATRLVVSFVGYNSQSILIDPKSEQIQPIVLKMQAALMGEVIIVRQPFLKRVYYRFIKRPVRKIFG